MPQYIDREKIKLNSLSWIDGEGDILVPLVEVRKAIAQTPAEDVVAVVRCKDCEHYGLNSPIVKNKHCLYFSGYDEIFTEPNDYCSYAERKENESSID